MEWKTSKSYHISFRFLENVVVRNTWNDETISKIGRPNIKCCPTDEKWHSEGVKVEHWLLLNIKWNERGSCRWRKVEKFAIYLEVLHKFYNACNCNAGALFSVQCWTVRIVCQLIFHENSNNNSINVSWRMCYQNKQFETFKCFCSIETQKMA